MEGYNKRINGVRVMPESIQILYILFVKYGLSITDAETELINLCMHYELDLEDMEAAENIIKRYKI